MGAKRKWKIFKIPPDIFLSGAFFYLDNKEFTPLDNFISHGVNHEIIFA
jgi:hypothetical protein